MRAIRSQRDTVVNGWRCPTMLRLVMHAGIGIGIGSIIAIISIICIGLALRHFTTACCATNHRPKPSKRRQLAVWSCICLHNLSNTRERQSGSLNLVCLSQPNVIVLRAWTCRDENIDSTLLPQRTR
mmetsp:Transcript_69387/g.151531  ORF Transcript_69387/g.151531 Transcript_69387/m.151531 type:complete len:127 (-) Transcript_69387:8-388(-)